MIKSLAENWVFLGDSLTEGVGSSRISYVTELINIIRIKSDYAVDEIKIRRVDESSFSRFVKFNLAGKYDSDSKNTEKRLYVWNFASEGKLISDDEYWLNWIHNIRPNRIFLFRGSLESIIRPSALKDGDWPVWVPLSWRGYASMDPRCYYSNTLFRKLKQQFVDHFKQRVRLYLLRKNPGVSLVSTSSFIDSYTKIIMQLKKACEHIHMLSLLTVDDGLFPGSMSQFKIVNDELRKIAIDQSIDFVDWSREFELRSREANVFYLDGFHPNQAGAEMLGEILYEYIAQKLSWE